MYRGYTFRRIRQNEVPIMFAMILERMKWMDESGIQQWNVTAYDKAYPQSWYEAEQHIMKGMASFQSGHALMGRITAS